MNSLGDQPNTAVIAVHGIGGQKRGETLQELFSSLNKDDSVSKKTQRTLRSVSHEGGEIEYESIELDAHSKLAEYYWANMSSIKTGLVASLQNFWFLFTEVPDIIYSALGPEHNGDNQRDALWLKIFRALIAFSYWNITVLVVGVNIAYAALFSGMSLVLWLELEKPDGTDTLSHEEWLENVNVFYEVSPNSGFVFLISAVMLLVIVFLAWRFRKRPTIVAALLVAGLAFTLVLHIALNALRTGAQNQAFSHYMELISWWFPLVWFYPFFLEFFLLILVPIVAFRARHRLRAVLLTFAAYHFTVRLWLVLITTLWLSIVSFLLHDSIYDIFVPEIGEALGVASIAWLDTFLAILIICIIWLVNAVRSKNQKQLTNVLFWRLIIPMALVWLAVISAVYWLVALQSFTCNQSPRRFCLLELTVPDAAISWFDPITTYIVLGAPLILAIGGILIQIASPGFDVGTDIVNYFKTNRGHRHANPLKVASTTLSYQTKDADGFHSKAVAGFNALGSDMVTAFGPFDRTIVLAHSLGTMFAVEAMRNWPKQDFGELHLITMGSPYGSIFSYYFPHLYPPLSSKDVMHLASWTNVFRENDYVGTTIVDEVGFVRNVPLPPRGHLNYFSEPVVIRTVENAMSADS